MPLELGVLGEDAQDVEAVPGEQQVVGRPPAVGADLAVGVGELGEADLGRGRVGAGTQTGLPLSSLGERRNSSFLGQTSSRSGAWGGLGMGLVGPSSLRGVTAMGHRSQRFPVRCAHRPSRTFGAAGARGGS